MSAQANEKYCVTCGKPIHEKAEICPHCGVRQPMMSSASKGREKLTAGMLAIVLGGLGVHKFYLGQNGMGIVYLVFCWTLIPAFVGFVEGVILLVMSDEDFNRKYNSPTAS